MGLAILNMHRLLRELTRNACERRTSLEPLRRDQEALVDVDLRQNGVHRQVEVELSSHAFCLVNRVLVDRPSAAACHLKRGRFTLYNALAIFHPA